MVFGPDRLGNACQLHRSLLNHLDLLSIAFLVDSMYF
jgi:hypothetical protein